MFGYFLTLRRRRSETPEFDGEQRPRRKWKYIFVIITIDLLFVTAIAQLLLGLLLFNYVEVPASLLIGEILTLVAVYTCSTMAKFAWLIDVVVVVRSINPTRRSTLHNCSALSLQ